MNKELGQQLLDAHGRDAYVLAVVLAERLLQQGGEAGCDPARKRREEFWLLEVYAINLVALGRCANAETALDRADRIVTEERRPWLIHRRASIAEAPGQFWRGTGYLEGSSCYGT
ncbi:MAG: hypothetical protein O3C21_04190 [Verrucomicrobia bacterium]|nr:hypothetical protein [Verrucomicrobiota bacterium]